MLKVDDFDSNAVLGSVPADWRDRAWICRAANVPGPGFTTWGTGRERLFDLDTAWESLPQLPAGAPLLLDSWSNQLSLVQLRRFLHRACHVLTPGAELAFVVRDPDAVTGTELTDTQFWPGESYPTSRGDEFHRPLRHYWELARLFPLTLRTPQPLPGPAGEPRLLFLRAVRQSRQETFHATPTSDPEKYGATSVYQRFVRAEEPEILDDWMYAFSRLHPQPGEKVLSIGVNDGSELEVLVEVMGRSGTEGQGSELWGLDNSESALDRARERLPEHRDRFLCADTGDLPNLGLPQFQVVILLNVLQCTTVDRDRLLADLQPLLAPGARLLISIPNCHFGSFEILRRPLDRSDPRHDRSPVFKEIRFLARRFYRAGFRDIETFGTYDLFVLVR